MPKRDVRFFNTTGPCNPDDHYMLPPEERLIGAQLHRYIRDNLYWVLHAPRQTGKTTFLQSWMREINSNPQTRDTTLACYVTIERCQGITEIERSMPALAGAVRDCAGMFGMPIPESTADDPAGLLSNILGNWARLVAPKRLVVLFDEADVLQGESLISFLRQLRGGFAGRGPGSFPVSIALVGMRDLKDYITTLKGGVAPNPGSPFNVKSDSAMIGNFLKADIARLFAQRTAETGQQITQEALDYIYDQSRGQPWIVNSLLQRATMRILHEDSTETVTLAHVREAREQMVLARETHLDALAYRLEDPRVRSLLDSLVSGVSDPDLATGEGFRLCLDLGLVTIERGTPQVANPIYREVLARQMTYGPQLAIPEPAWRWQKPDGSLDMDALLREFQKFWRRHAEIWEPKFDYTEAFPHLLLMAFLQRVTNGDGRIDREYAAGRGRLDLLVEYKGASHIIEVKLIHSYDTPAAVREEGIEQILPYRDRVAPDAPCYLLIFDRREKTKQLPWEQRITWEQEAGVTILGC
jgi:hypothetical protein